MGGFGVKFVGIESIKEGGEIFIKRGFEAITFNAIDIESEGVNRVIDRGEV